MELNFSDEELSVIHAVLTKADPMSLVSQIQSALVKIRAYAESKTQAQATEAASLPVMDSPSD